MLRKLRSRSTYANVVATWRCSWRWEPAPPTRPTPSFSADIVDGEVKSVDIGNNEIGSSDVKDNSINTFDVHSFLGADVVDGSLTGADMANNSSARHRPRSTGLSPQRQQKDHRATLQGSDVAANTLTGDDINESSLNLPQHPTTATFAGVTAGQLDGTFTKFASKTCRRGARGHRRADGCEQAFGLSVPHPIPWTSSCANFRNGSGFIGGAARPQGHPRKTTTTKVSLSMNGGALGTRRRWRGEPLVCQAGGRQRHRRLRPR